LFIISVKYCVIAEKCSNLRLAKSGKCESFSVNDHFERKRNAEVGFYGQTPGHCGFMLAGIVD
jgi:hypothetical protein